MKCGARIGRAIACPPDAEPARPAMTLTAIAAPISGLPGMLVISSTACWKAGVSRATPPKPTTAAVLAMAIRAPSAPSAIGSCRLP